MEGPEIMFLFQFGNIRDMVSAPASALTLKMLKDMACDFINSKVNEENKKNTFCFRQCLRISSLLLRCHSTLTILLH